MAESQVLLRTIAAGESPMTLLLALALFFVIAQATWLWMVVAILLVALIARRRSRKARSARPGSRAA